jgi:hypothetical protein
MPGAVSIPARALELELQSPPALGQAYGFLRDLWRTGQRERDVGLHLMFLAWYIELEPAHLTGRDQQPIPSDELSATFSQVHAYFAASIEGDVEMLYVVGVMAKLCPWCLGDSAEWHARALEYRRLYRRLAPAGLNPAIFDGRGYYGDYFASQARVPSGY